MTLDELQRAVLDYGNGREDRYGLTAIDVLGGKLRNPKDAADFVAVLPGLFDLFRNGKPQEWEALRLLTEAAAHPSADLARYLELVVDDPTALSEPGAKLEALHTWSALGGIITLPRLDTEQSVKTAFPADWLDLAIVAAGGSVLVIKKLLTEMCSGAQPAVPMQLLKHRLPTLMKLLGPSGFVDAMRAVLNGLSNDEDRDALASAIDSYYDLKLLDWLKQGRGSTQASAPAFRESNRMDTLRAGIKKQKALSMACD